MIYRYTVNAIPPSNNKFIGRDARWAYQKIKKEWEGYIWAASRGEYPIEPIEKSVIRITYYFRDHRRRDPDNYSGKMILDALTRTGIIKDDNFGCIKLELSAGCDTKNPRTEIEVEECES